VSVLENLLRAGEELPKLARQLGSLSQQLAELRGRVEGHQRVIEQLVHESGVRTRELTNMAANVVELHREVLRAIERPAEVLDVDVSEAVDSG
jgi:ribulose 1,5-bisphosphate carboxylase large subunit-like protein